MCAKRCGTKRFLSKLGTQMLLFHYRPARNQCCFEPFILFFGELKEARATCCKLHTRGRKFLERLSPWNCPRRSEPSADNLGSAAYTEVARLRLWPESRIWGRKDALHSKTRHSIVVMKVAAVVPTGLQCAVEVQTQQMSDAERSPRTLAAWSLTAVVRARLLL